MMPLDYNAFIRSISSKADGSISFFLGAGASVSSGIPTASQLIWEFKRKIYCQENRIPERNLQDIELESNRNTIQNFFDRNGTVPKLDSPLEYSFYFEKCFPIQEDRRLFIERIVSGINPSLGYLCLGELISSGSIRHIWTTNFDDLIESGVKTINPQLPLTTVSPEQLGFSSNTVKIVKFHGDFRYANIQNTTEELEKANNEISDYFKSEMRNKGIVFIGYSGNDNSILSLLEDIVQRDDNFFNKGFYWCKRKSEILNERIVSIINKIGKKAYIVEIESFDECMYDICLTKGIASKTIQDQISERKLQLVPFSFPKNYERPDCIKLNAYEVTEYLRSCFSFSVNSTLENIENLEKDKNFISIVNGKNVYAIGNRASIEQAFHKYLSSNIEIKDIKFGSSLQSGLMYKLISRELCRHGLKQTNKNNKGLFICQTKAFDRYHRYFAYEAIDIQLFFISSKVYMLLLPTVYLPEQRISHFSRSKKISSILATRYSKKVNDLLNSWNEKIPYEFSLDDFHIKRNKVPCFIRRSCCNDFNSFIVKEPNLSFSFDTQEQRSIHPLKGLNYYHPLTANSNMPALRLAVISPEETTEKILSFLNSLNDYHTPVDEKDYLLDYEGFEKIYKRSLSIPSDRSPLLEKIRKETIQDYSYLNFYDHIKHILDDFYVRRNEFDVLVIYIPKEWKHFREKKEGSIYFDLHDSVKIYAAQKNIKIQFIEERSIMQPNRAKVAWWLSLALYTKASGIPWSIEKAEKDSAYIGIGFAIKRTGINKISIGTSQVFDSTGLGLRFYMQPIKTPIYIGKNPYMSKNDARQLITNLKTSYYSYDPSRKLKRVVIHKTIPFIEEEISGISEALCDIENIELIQIQRHKFFRGFEGINYSGELKLNNYPIRRGTVVILDLNRFLLWTHGSVKNNEIVKNRDYYQGARGIPSPLLIKRFLGKDPIEKIAYEILALSKMNWNGAQLYSTMPVTLDFSSDLACMSKQSEQLPNKAFDFRLFI